MKQRDPENTLLVIAGPNGSGKSSLVCESGLYIENDMIINVDNYARNLYDFGDVNERHVLAVNVCETIRNNLLELGKSFGFETVASKQDKIDFIRKAKSKGYRIHLIFVTAGSPDMCCERIAERVRMGGHDVPEEKVRQRYERTMKNLHVLIELSDEAIVFDNSGDSMVCVLEKNDKGIVVKDTEVGEEWIAKYVRPFLK